MYEYASWEGCAVRYDPVAGKAWIYGLGKWSELNIADARVKAKVLTEVEYEKAHPRLPPLPA
jgi:hypothetical protein